MVPQRGSPQSPCFPQCVEWILQNQQDDGSWGIFPSGSPISKDILLSTMACVLALKRWNTGHDQISKGLNFIGRNFYVAMDEKAASPLGFNITFSGMLSLATGMGLELLIMQTDIDRIFHLRKIELESVVAIHQRATPTLLSKNTKKKIVYHKKEAVPRKLRPRRKSRHKGFRTKIDHHSTTSFPRSDGPKRDTTRSATTARMKVRTRFSPEDCVDGKEHLDNASKRGNSAHGRHSHQTGQKHDKAFTSAFTPPTKASSHRQP
uniref:Squalene cyclase N-terminal domain-containing protein n=1 Tax=Leersia perrieri TaxID=77586 RepID=A0A0D9X6J7_9ORYZ